MKKTLTERVKTYGVGQQVEKTLTHFQEHREAYFSAGAGFVVGGFCALVLKNTSADVSVTVHVSNTQ